MPISIRPLHPVFAGEVSGVNITADISTADFDAAMDKYALLVIPGQDITDAQQIAFSERFGELEIPGSASNVTAPEDRRLSGPVADISNLGPDDQLLRRDDRQRMFNLGNLLWHSDSSFRPIPAKYSMLSGRIVPDKGGDTEFADMRAAYDALDAATKAEIEDLVCEHSLLYSRELMGFTELSAAEKNAFTPVLQRLVRTHPVTGRKSLYLSAHAGTIQGWPMPEARGLLRDLTEHATQREFVYRHKWRSKDLVIWDNRQTMHRATRFNDTEVIRDMHRTTVAGTEPTVPLPMAHAPAPA
ncbi:MAG: 2,4-dichlorophenoxyacetate dioxygenase [Sneathiella sp.]|nr:MAG: 2,4-dichlorophenoxyacetate dioxygenase [Sneathiella sp.]